MIVSSIPVRSLVETRSKGEKEETAWRWGGKITFHDGSISDGEEIGIDEGKRSPLLRREPTELKPEQVMEIVKIRNFNHPGDYEWHGLLPRIITSYIPKICQISEFVLKDENTGLLWNREGSPRPIPWDKVNAFFDSLNAKGYGGIRTWRAPSVEELASLMTSEKSENGIYLNTQFGKVQRNCWSNDTTNKQRTAWFVAFGTGFINIGHVSEYFFVKAVSSQEGL